MLHNSAGDGEQGKEMRTFVEVKQGFVRNFQMSSAGEKQDPRVLTDPRGFSMPD